MTIPQGTQLGRYEIRSQLGAGGMGEVYLAEDTKLDRKVALKILPADVAAHPDRMKRFVQEAKAASALNHPNIITIHEIDVTDSGHFIATEFIDGETLRQHMRKAPMKFGDVLDIAGQIASALSAAHSAGIVHRDIKPENIMLRRDGIVKVLDFGLAKLTERSSPDSVDMEAPTRPVVNTEPGLVMGTVIYMSPEQARGVDIDARTDIWSLGVVLYEMVAGCLPFAGSTSSEVLASILGDKETQPLARYSREVPAELERIVSKALRKNRDERYQTVKDLLLDLKSLTQELEFERKLERSLPPKSQSPADMEEQAAAKTVMGSAARQTVSEKPMSALRLNQRTIVLAVGALLIIVSAAGAYFYFTRARSGAINSIAVLPFVNETGNADVEYLSDGMTESLINNLSQLPNLSVKAHSTVFRFKGKAADPQTMAAQLSVQAILNGRVVQRGDDLTLYLSLIDGRNGNQLWGEQYNRKLTDLVALQNEIARDVSRKLRARLSGADERKVARNYTDNAEAYQLYLKGRYHYLRLTRPEIDKAIAYYQQAIALDQSYALAYTGLSAAYRSLALTSDVPSIETLPKAKAAALRALEIDETLAEAHANLGVVAFWYDWDWKAAEKHFLRALELDPNDATPHLGYAQLLSNLGQHEKALIEAKRARELEPLTLRINAGEGQALFFAGRYDESIDRLQKTIELDPNFWLSHLFLSRVYIEKKMYAEAIAEATKAKDLSGGNSEAVAHVVYALAKAGKQEEARRTLDELKKRAAVSYVPPYAFALSYNGLGETDQAIAWLVKGLEQREVKMTLLTVDPKWNNLRSDPRFQDVLRRAGFAQ